MNNFDVIVIGAGHAGIEAALACARRFLRVLVVSLTLDNIALLACNPSIGGTAKAHLVREVDALGGEMGCAADHACTQMRMLNRSKGAAVWSLRAQVDKYRYQAYMRQVLEKNSFITLRQAEVVDILRTQDGSRVRGVVTKFDQIYCADAVIICSGVYLDSRVIVGSHSVSSGPGGLPSANGLADSLRAMAVPLRRFKTGTPARVHRRSLDLHLLERQDGEADIINFSARTRRKNPTKTACYLGYTNPDTHQIIRDNLHLSPRHSGLVSGVGARYCPSIEDKVVRFADKERHQFFVESEGECTEEMYLQGLSTGLPAQVQQQIYRSIRGLERVEIMRDAYAIEYECIDPTVLRPTLEHKQIAGLYFAGQINGTSGYEEAAAQGIVAGINAGQRALGLGEVIFDRSQSYIGVLIDDLVTQGTDEPYRMMTSRAEHRLALRQDNAEFRLTPVGIAVGLVTGTRARRFRRAQRDYQRGQELLQSVIPADRANAFLVAIGSGATVSGSVSVASLLRYNGVTHANFCQHFETFLGLDSSVVFSLVIEAQYAGYIERVARLNAEQQRLEKLVLPRDIDYMSMDALSMESREKLSRIQPMTLGQASRISGVTPADINVLIVCIKKRARDLTPGDQA